MNIKYLNESFKKLYEAAIDEEPQVNSNLNEIRTQLEDATMRLQYRGATNIKEYEIAFQEAIENVFPDKSWWEITDCNIFFTLFETRSPELTIEQIIAELKPEYKDTVEENLDELLDADIDLNLDASGSSVGFLGGTGGSIANEELNESSERKIAQIPMWAYDKFYTDPQGMFGEPDRYSVGDIMEIWNDNCDSDPSMQEFDSFDSWWNETKKYMTSEDDLIKEALEKCLNKLNEAAISDEDQRDSDLIRSMIDKISRRKNAKFSPEEQAVLDKYGIQRNNWDQSLRVDGVNLDRDVDSKSSNSVYYGKYSNGTKSKINYADRARKTPARRDNQVWGPQGGRYYSGNDWVNKHDGKPRYGFGNGSTLQDAERSHMNDTMQQPVVDMKQALRDRKYNKKYMDSAQTDYDDAVAKAKKAYDDAVARAERNKEDATTGYHKKGFDRAQGEIDKLLKRKPKED